MEKEFVFRYCLHVCSDVVFILFFIRIPFDKQAKKFTPINVSVFSVNSIPKGTVDLEFLCFNKTQAESLTCIPVSTTSLSFQHCKYKYPPPCCYMDEYGSGSIQQIYLRLDLPPHVTRLTISGDFYVDLELTNCPHLTHLTCEDGANVSVANLPSSLTHLAYGQLRSLDRNMDATTLPNLTFLDLADSFFNSPIDYFPRAITHLILTNGFNYPLDNLPSSLQLLQLGYRFNRSVNRLPSSLTELILGHNFNRPVDRLPPKLQYVFYCLLFASLFFT